MLRRIAIAFVGMAALGALVIALTRGNGRNVVVMQPIAFNHQVHRTKAKLGCTTVCHSAASTEVYAGLPSKHVCLGCHDPEENSPQKPELTRLAGYADLEEDIPWQRVAVTRSHVFFSHRRHVAAGKIECVRCHPGVAEATQPLSRVSLVLKMDDCLDCHRHEGADVDCLACHR